MADCRIVNQSVLTTCSNIGAIAETAEESFTNAANTFVTNFNAAIEDLSGASKDALATFFTEQVVPYVQTSIPNMVISFRDLLESNRSNFEETDSKLATSIANSENA